MDILILVVAIIDIILSIWNAYASGYNSIILRKAEERNIIDWRITLFSLANQFSLVLAFAGATYGTALLLGYILTLTHHISYQTLIALYSLNSLVFGGLIVFTGIVIAIQSIVSAYYSRRAIDIVTAIYNTIVSIWNVVTYVSNFENLLSAYQSSEEEDRNRALIILALAAIIGIVLTFYAYQLGRKKAIRETGFAKV